MHSTICSSNQYINSSTTNDSSYEKFVASYKKLHSTRMALLPLLQTTRLTKNSWLHMKNFIQPERRFFLYYKRLVLRKIRGFIRKTSFN